MRSQEIFSDESEYDTDILIRSRAGLSDPLDAEKLKNSKLLII